MKRRKLLQGAAAGALGARLLWAPQSASAAETGGHAPYFAQLNEMLKASGPGRPVMLLDVQRMMANLDNITASVGRDKTYRVVVKSLPSVPLLAQVMKRAKTRALMVFHQPFLNAIAEAFPDADALMGKPMPVAAARTFYRSLGKSAFNPATQVQWLIDTPERLAQYQGLAKELGVQMRLNFELDVGLHRGGFEQPEQLATALATVAGDPQHLSVSGLMGYEPHLTGLKADLGHPAVRDVLSKYQGHIERIRAAGLDPDKLTLNGAGSHTLKIYRRDKTMNDLSAGSGVVMPTDFDTHHLEDHEPAVFIATPILKRYRKNTFMPDPPPDMAQVYYIYGGKWKAKMVSPAVVSKPIYESTNQSPIGTPADTSLEVDDYMFLRPTQSEFVMLQFGDLLVVDKGEIAQTWPVFGG